MTEPKKLLFVAPWTLSALRPRPFQFADLLADEFDVHYVLATWSEQDERDAAQLRGSSVTTVRMNKFGGLARAVFALPSSRSLQQAFMSSRALRRAIREVEAKVAPDVAIFNVTRTSHLAAELRGRPALVFDMDELRSNYYKQTSEHSNNWVTRMIGRLEAPRMHRAEIAAMNRYDLVLVSSPVDSIGAARNVRNVRGGSLLELAEPRSPSGSVLNLLFSGRMSYRANIEAATWFVLEVMPKLRRHGISVHLTIVGEDPSPSVLALRADDITVVGRVPDMTPFFQSADVVLVPITMATGVQQKLIGGLASGRLTVCTSRVAELAGVQHRQQVLIADTANEWVSAIEAALNDETIIDVVLRGQEWVVKNYAKASVRAHLFEVVAEASSLLEHGPRPK